MSASFGGPKTDRYPQSTSVKKNTIQTLKKRIDSMNSNVSDYEREEYEKQKQMLQRNQSSDLRPKTARRQVYQADSAETTAQKPKQYQQQQSQYSSNQSKKTVKFENTKHFATQFEESADYEPRRSAKKEPVKDMLNLNSIKIDTKRSSMASQRNSSKYESPSFRGSVSKKSSQQQAPSTKRKLKENVLPSSRTATPQRQSQTKHLVQMNQPAKTEIKHKIDYINQIFNVLYLSPESKKRIQRGAAPATKAAVSATPQTPNRMENQAHNQNNNQQRATPHETPNNTHRRSHSEYASVNSGTKSRAVRQLELLLAQRDDESDVEQSHRIVQENNIQEQPSFYERYNTTEQSQQNKPQDAGYQSSERPQFTDPIEKNVTDDGYNSRSERQKQQPYSNTNRGPQQRSKSFVGERVGSFEDVAQSYQTTERQTSRGNDTTNRLPLKKQIKQEAEKIQREKSLPSSSNNEEIKGLKEYYNSRPSEASEILKSPHQKDNYDSNYQSIGVESATQRYIDSLKQANKDVNQGYNSNNIRIQENYSSNQDQPPLSSQGSRSPYQNQSFNPYNHRKDNDLSPSQYTNSSQRTPSKARNEYFIKEFDKIQPFNPELRKHQQNGLIEPQNTKEKFYASNKNNRSQTPQTTQRQSEYQQQPLSYDNSPMQSTFKNFRSNSRTDLSNNNSVQNTKRQQQQYDEEYENSKYSSNYLANSKRKQSQHIKSPSFDIHNSCVKPQIKNQRHLIQKGNNQSSISPNNDKRQLNSSYSPLTSRRDSKQSQLQRSGNPHLKNFENIIIDFDRNLKPFVGELKKSVSNHSSPCKKKCGSPVRKYYDPSQQNEGRSYSQQEPANVISPMPVNTNRGGYKESAMTTDFNITATTDRQNNNHGGQQNQYEQKLDFMYKNVAQAAENMKNFYEEINGLTQRITEAAVVMTSALEKLENFTQRQEGGATPIRSRRYEEEQQQQQSQMQNTDPEMSRYPKQSAYDADYEYTYN